ncbi:hypothetical protein BX600DRAFT_509967 [Xylariales sp. PMI_506]|nr:hypothetical protein BX600DRAFT_509967 [Xylariales sp. PMI_506]
MASPSVNRYWIPHLDIHKKVITQELQYYLGPDATVRSYTREGEDGFLISTSGPCLTDEQIDDICVKSKEVWDKQAAAKAASNPEKQLKRPLHQPILVSSSDGSRRRTSSDRKKHDARGPYSDRRRGSGYRR